MIKRAAFFSLVLLSALSLCAEQEPIPWRQDITMLTVPREPLAVQIAQDISRRYPVLLICYQQTRSGPILHAWNGEGWVGVSVSDYTNGTFFTHRPRHAILVEEEARPAPDELIPDGSWCDRGNRLSSTDPRVMIHLLGRHFDFPYRYWMQFAKRYNYELEEINPALINVIWWHYPVDQAVAAFKARDVRRDMDKWSDLEIVQPAPASPVVIMEEPAELPPAEIPVEEIIDRLNRLSAEKPAVKPEEETENVPQPEPGHVEIVFEAADQIAEEEPEALQENVEVRQQKIEETLKQVTAEEGINPFSTNDIPAARVILPE